MEYVRVEHSALTSAKPLDTKQVTLLWAQDGWCYIPQLKIRQRFTEKLYYREEWTGVIALPEYIETVTWTLFSKEPLVWREQGPQYSEVYSTKQKGRPNAFSAPSTHLKKQPFLRN